METSEEFDFGEVHDRLSSTDQSSEILEVENGKKQVPGYIDEDWGESTAIDSHHPDKRSSKDDPSKEEQTKKEKQDSFPPASLEILKCYGKGLKRLRNQKIMEATNGKTTLKVASPRLSTEEIIRTAGKRAFQSFNNMVDVSSMQDNPFDVSFSCLSNEDAKKVELVELLLASTENIVNQQYDQASILLDKCDALSSSTGNAVQRVVHYFSKALRKRINRDTGRITTQDLEKLQSLRIHEINMAPTPIVLACHREMPFSQVANFTGVQIIIGVQWTGLMQALASQSEHPLELLKITAIGTTKKHLIEDTGKRLEGFAQTISLPFCFKLIMVSDMLDLREDLFELDDDETVVVYSGFSLRGPISLPDRLDSVMQVIRNLNPHLLLVVEPELSLSLTSFVNRTVEALGFFGAYFDCLEDCMSDDPTRIIKESSLLSEGISIAIDHEGKEWKSRCAKLDAWRAFFARFGMEETKMSSSSLCQANLVAKKFAGGNSCTLAVDGGSLLIGWKGKPMYSLSAWKFVSQK
ncbi:hypothetical protein MANES_03G203700v8 [Manihot esculenta]|uniref:Uncharacterized protein n=1 Tax=Manihot esculenta TaxID=3983 RepID=A0ACB7I743_MANES|nr:hypothetical protein MANES_03G203700v8 [Manihot esculenta]